MVASDTVSEISGDLKRHVERHDGERVDATQDGRHRARSGTQHVDIGIVEAHANFGIGSMDVHLGVFLLATVGLHDVGPQQAVGTHLGQLHEVVLTHSKVKAHFGCNLVDGEAFLGKFVEVFGTHGEAESHLLDDG